jgi:hypothetical protein
MALPQRYKLLLYFVRHGAFSHRKKSQHFTPEWGCHLPMLFIPKESFTPQLK